MELENRISMAKSLLEKKPEKEYFDQIMLDLLKDIEDYMKIPDTSEVMKALELCSKGCGSDGCEYMPECDGLGECKACVEYLTADALRILRKYAPIIIHDRHDKTLDAVWMPDAPDVESAYEEAETSGELITILARFPEDTKVCGVGGGALTITRQAKDPWVLWME